MIGFDHQLAGRTEPLELFGRHATVATVDLEQQAFEVRRDLNIHARAQRGGDTTCRHVAVVDEAGQNVIRVGCNNEVGDRSSHLAGDPTRQHVAEVAGRHTRGDRPDQRLRGGHVVHNLRHHASPVDRVDSRQPKLVAERVVAKHCFDQILAVVKRAVDRNRVHVWTVDGGHLTALHLACTTGRIHNHDVDIFAGLDAIDRRRSGVATRGTDDRDPLATLRQHMIKQTADELESDIFEGQRRAVKQLQQPLSLVDLNERYDCGMAELGIRVTAEFGQNFERQVVTDERRHHGGGSFGVVVNPRQVWKVRPIGRQIQPAVGR